MDSSPARDTHTRAVARVAPVPILTNDVIAEAMQRARLLVCPPDGKRCACWSSSAESALATLSADGCGTIGLLIDMTSHGHTWDMRFNVDSGEERLDRVP
jgi:hypothetical protein